jgi:hypothetical protein
MQTSIDTEILETIFTHATTVARLASYIDNGIIIDGLTRSTNHIRRIVAGILGKAFDPEMPREPVRDSDHEFDAADAIDELRQIVSRGDALANAALEFLDEVVWIKDVGDHRRIERLAHLVGATADTMSAAVVLGERIAEKLSSRQRGD